MIDSIIKILNKLKLKQKKDSNSKDTAKERLHLVLMQDRANVSADFLELMKQEIIEVIKKYIEVDETSIDVRLTNKENNDGTTGAPALYANIPIINLKDEAKTSVKNVVESVDLKSNKEFNNSEKKFKDNFKPEVVIKKVRETIKKEEYKKNKNEMKIINDEQKVLKGNKVSNKRGKNEKENA